MYWRTKHELREVIVLQTDIETDRKYIHIATETPKLYTMSLREWSYINLARNGNSRFNWDTGCVRFTPNLWDRRRRDRCCDSCSAERGVHAATACRHLVSCDVDRRRDGLRAASHRNAGAGALAARRQIASNTGFWKYQSRNIKILPRTNTFKHDQNTTPVYNWR